MNTLTSHPSNLSDPAIFIDESGSIGSNIDYNKNNPFFIYGFCYCKNPKIMGEKLKSELYMCKQNSIYPPKLNEIKFYPTKLCDLGYTNKEIKPDWEASLSYN